MDLANNTLACVFRYSHKSAPLRRRSKFLASFGFSEPDLGHSKLISTILVKQNDIRGHRRQISGTSPSHEYVSPAPVLDPWYLKPFVIALPLRSNI